MKTFVSKDLGLVLYQKIPSNTALSFNNSCGVVTFAASLIWAAATGNFRDISTGAI
jgi:hypothetical protein